MKVMKIPPKNFLMILAAAAAILVGYSAIQNQQLKRQGQLQTGDVTTPSIVPTPSSTKPSQTPTPLVRIPIISTAGWKEVSVDGVYFKIPADAECFKGDCRYIRVPPYSNIYVNVLEYKGGSRRSYFPIDQACKPIYIDSIFGNVKALQIAIDGGECQGGGGGAVAVVGNKIISVGYLIYDSATKKVYRWSVLDTVVSTLK